MKRYLKLAAFAERAKLPVTIVYDWVLEGRIDADPTQPGCYIAESELEKVKLLLSVDEDLERRRPDDHTDPAKRLHG